MEWPLLHPEDLEKVLPWFDDQETRKRLGGFYPVGQQLRLIDQDPNKHAWLATENGQPFGLCELEVEAGTIGHVLILIAPALRGQRKAGALINHLTQAATGLDLQELHAWIEPDALASRASFMRGGYEDTKTEADGFHLFRLTLSS